MSDRGDPVNLDLINMVQNARMKHDSDAIPSKVPGVYWIEAKRPPDDYPEPTPHTGEWRIATTVDKVDEQWLKIKQATEAGKLGYKSKVSTAPAHGQADRDERLICVRTYNAGDSEDVERVKQMLETLGFTELQYQSDREQQ